MKLGSISRWTLFLFIFKVILDILNLLHFHMDFTISFSISAIKATRIFIQIVISLQINLGIITILKMFSLLIHEYRMSFDLFRSLLISFQQCFIFLVYESCTSFKCYWVFYSFLYYYKRNSFLISFSGFSVLLYKIRLLL